MFLTIYHHPLSPNSIIAKAMPVPPARSIDRILHAFEFELFLSYWDSSRAPSPRMSLPLLALSAVKVNSVYFKSYTNAQLHRAFMRSTKLGSLLVRQRSRKRRSSTKYSGARLAHTSRPRYPVRETVHSAVQHNARSCLP